MTVTHKEWLELNPLKQWLEENRRSQAFMASYLGVAPYTVYHYLQGMYVPKNHWDKLIDITEDDDFVLKWADWIKMREEGKVDYTSKQSDAVVDQA